MAEPLHIPLKFPFTGGAGNRIDKLPIRRLKRKDISTAQQHAKNEAELEDLLAARMTGLTLEDLGELDIADSRTVTEVFRDVVGGGDGSAVLGRGAVARAENAAE
ncbi:phage tail assembly protein [Metapseudomonas otitidis]|uniref:phage tail assembly protein n=1 Tax=Metapseudomonas otitidis TaxID=319939 RepID=UPI002447F322|nr:phage tail assembly protein [Pseudomonas otitidis]MDG9783710.1 phage tail assembly protein [Pseudomonas otitidis]